MANQLKFSEFCNILEEIRGISDHNHKRKKLLSLYENLRVKTDAGDGQGGIYPVMRLLLPSLERNRSYGMKEDALRRSIIKIVCLGKNSVDANILKSSHDFAVSAYNVLRKYYSEGKDLTVKEVNESLDVIAIKGQINLQNDAMSDLFKRTSPFEQKWILRIILKQLGLGFGQKKILNLFHPDAETLFDNTNDLKHVCETLHDKTVHISEIQIRLFAHFYPMLSKRCDAKELIKVAGDNRMFFLENKYDGERFQLHMKDGAFMYYSRRGYDFTRKFGQSYSTGIYTPLLEGVFDDSVKSIILDGEMMGYDTEKKRFGSKGMNFDVKNLTDTTRHQPCFCVFDVVYLNDKVLTQTPLYERKDILKSLINPIEGVILVSEGDEVHGKQQIVNALNESAKRKEEGIVFKDPNSLYVTNSRNGGCWKMKMDYFAGVMSDLDVIIMGGYYGRGDKIDRVIAGVAVPSKRGVHPTVFHSIATLSTGLSNAEWEIINNTLKSSWVKTQQNKHESHGLFFGKKKPDVWVAPEKSCILEVRASELTKANKINAEHKANYTLRFHRVQKVRLDKPYYDCLTTAELDELTSSNQTIEKLFKRPLEMEDIECELQNNKKIRKKYTIDTVEVDETVSNILKDLEFCIWTGNEKYKVLDVEKIVKENGGNIAKIETQNTYCILMGDKHPRVGYYKGEIDVVKLSWLFLVLENKEFYEYEPLDMVYTTEATKNKFMETFDKFGDSYTEELNIHDLKFIVNNMKDRSYVIRPIPSEIEEFHEEINLKTRLQLFSNYTAYFDKFEVVNDASSAVIYKTTTDEMNFRFWGGRVSRTLNDDVNLVIVSSCNPHRVESIKEVYNGKIETEAFIDVVVAEYLDDVQ